MAKPIDHPNEPGRWTCLETADGAALWRRDRSDPMPVTMFYLLAPPRQTVILYDEAQARAQFAPALAAGDADQDA